MTQILLTREQENLVNLRDGSYLILAPPGTGKTEVIVHRIVRLLSDSAGASFRTLALTFNNRAAALMRQRVRDLLGDQTWRATIETYHSFYLDILRHYGSLIEVPPEVTVYDTIDSRVHALSQGLIDEGFLLKNFNLDRREAESVLESISRMKRSLVTPSAAPIRTTGLGISLRDAYGAYEGALKRNGAVDFDGMLTRTYELLTEHPEVADHYRRMYSFILVDEAQDTSTVQFEILRTLCGSTHRNVFMVADPDQLINGWMGADRSNLDRFVADFGAETFYLTTNFRCADRIVEAANSLLSADVPKATPLATSQATGEVVAASYATEKVEAAAVVSWIVNIRDDGLPQAWLADGESRRVSPHELAILGRSRLHLREVLALLDEKNIPYLFRSGDDGPFDSDVYRIMLDALRVLANPRDLALRRTLLGELGIYQAEDGLDDDQLAVADLPTFLRAVADRDSTEAAEFVRPLADLTGISDAMNTLTTPLVAEAMEFEIGELLRADRELLTARWNRYKNSTESKDWTWSGIVMSLSSEPREDPGGIRVSTVHAAKGLEFRAVALVGLNDGSFPDFRSTESPDALAGERRLAYVAATRAGRGLLLSRPRRRGTRFGPRIQEPSRFLADMGVRPSDL